MKIDRRRMHDYVYENIKTGEKIVCKSCLDACMHFRLSKSNGRSWVNNLGLLKTYVSIHGEV